MIRNPFDHNYFLGYINNVTPQYINVHFPSSVLLKSFIHKGEQLNGGLVGNFVVIEGQQYGFLGKILELSLPEKERLGLSERSFNNNDFHPTGKIEILLSFDLFEPSKIEKGFGLKEEQKDNAPLINVGCLTYDKSAKI